MIKRRPNPGDKIVITSWETFRSGSKEGDIGCLHIEHLTDGEYNDNPSVSLQVFYGKEIYDMFLPIILSAYHGTEFYSLLMQRHRDEQIGKIFD